MTERRRGERHVFTQPGMATMRVTQDVEITRLNRTDVAVITTRALPLGERVLLEIFDDGSDAPRARLARTVDSRLVMKDGRLRREVRVSIIGPSEVADARDALNPEAGRRALVGAVSRRVPVRLVEVSSTGCLWESPASIDEGSVGFVDLKTFGHQCSEAVRILRMFEAVGSNWPYRMAAEFLTLLPVSPESLRGVAALVATGIGPAGRP